MTRISLAIGAAAIGLAASFAAQAAGLGRLIVLSSLGAPLVAEIELVSLQPGEEDGLSARLASSEAFRQAGIEPSAALSSVRIAVVRREGRPVLRLTSAQPVNDPFVDLLVELEWTGGRLVREYTVLLDPPEYKGPQAVAAAPAAPSSAPLAQPLPPFEARPPQPRAAAPEADSSAGAAVEKQAAVERPAEIERPAAVQRPAGANTYEVRRGDTLGEIARANLPPGVSLNQMMIAIYRANQDAFLRENINLVRAGRVLNLPTPDSVSGVGVEEANRLVQSHRTEWDEYVNRVASRPAPGEAASGQRAVTGKIAAKPEAEPSGPAQDRVRLSKADPAKSGAAARADDAAARERALREAQSRVTDLEKNVADLQKLLELKNQQLAELEKKAASKPAPVAPVPAKPEAKAEAKSEVKPPAKPAATAEWVKPEAQKPAPPVVVAEAPKPPAVAPAPEAKKPGPAPEAKKAEPAPEAKKAEPAPEAKKAEPAKPKPKAVAPPPPPPPSLLDEFLDNQIALLGLGLVVVLLLGYGVWSWRRKKAIQAKFSDSVLGGGTAPSLNEPGAASGDSQASVSQTSGMEAEEVDPIAEADVYMAYGRDAQAEEILKDALQKDPNRIPVHAKLAEIYAKRNDTKALEQTALKLKNLTGGSGPEWDKVVALGRAIDAGNGLYGGSTAAVATAAAMGAAAGAAASPAIDFDIGGGTSPGMIATDIPLDDQPKPATPSTIDFDLGAGTAPSFARAPDPDATVVAPLDFDLNVGGEEKKPYVPEPAPALAAAGDSASGLDFDLNLDLGTSNAGDADKTAQALDLSSISLDLGSAGEAGGAASSNDPKWQEVATKLDLAKAYEEMGDKDGARELLGEVMKDGDATQKGQAQQLLTKLG